MTWKLRNFCWSLECTEVGPSSQPKMCYTCFDKYQFEKFQLLTGLQQPDISKKNNKQSLFAILLVTLIDI